MKTWGLIQGRSELIDMSVSVRIFACDISIFMGCESRTFYYAAEKPLFVAAQTADRGNLYSRFVRLRSRGRVSVCAWRLRWAGCRGLLLLNRSSMLLIKMHSVPL